MGIQVIRTLACRNTTGKEGQDAQNIFAPVVGSSTA